MDREIKFRGIRIDNGEWVYGDIIRKNITDRNQHGIIFTKTVIKIIDWQHSLHSYEIEEETLTEFTGLKDRNGVEIFTGDILEYITLQIVEFGRYIAVNSQPIYGYYLKEIKTNYKYDILSLPRYHVIGNIFQNPELLENSHA